MLNWFHFLVNPVKIKLFMFHSQFSMDPAEWCQMRVFKLVTPFREAEVHNTARQREN